MNVYQDFLDPLFCWRTSFTYTQPNRRCGRDFHNCTICRSRLVVTAAISGENLPLSITTRAVGVHVMNVKEDMVV